MDGVVDIGSGPPLVLIPGVQGRWEWMRSAVDELARSFRVITFSLCDESPGQSRRTAPTLEDFCGQVEAAMNGCGVDRAVICGVSLGGRIALRFAARHPQRTSALILVSTPGPGWHLRPTHEIYARWPRLLAPLFFAGAPLRVRAEIAAALPDRRERLQFERRQLLSLLRAPLSPSRMARRATLIAGDDVTADCAAVQAPTLILCGEPRLDHVVPASGSVAFANLIQTATTATLDRTGHLGCLTRPAAFAAAIDDYCKSLGREPGVTAPGTPQTNTGSRNHAA